MGFARQALIAATEAVPKRNADALLAIEAPKLLLTVALKLVEIFFDVLT